MSRFFSSVVKSNRYSLLFFNTIVTTQATTNRQIARSTKPARSTKQARRYLFHAEGRRRQSYGGSHCFSHQFCPLELGPFEKFQHPAIEENLNVNNAIKDRFGEIGGNLELLSIISIRFIHPEKKRNLAKLTCYYPRDGIPRDSDFS